MRNLNGAHDSLVDAKAQTDVLLHPHFVQYIDRTVSIQEITVIFTKTQQNGWKKEMVLDDNQKLYTTIKRVELRSQLRQGG